MKALTRREWLALSMAGVGMGAAGRIIGAQPKSRWGVQLYTVRGLLAKDAAATLELCYHNHAFDVPPAYCITLSSRTPRPAIRSTV